MKQRKDKGTAGLTIMLSVIVTLFVLGLLIAIFAIMSGKLIESDSIYTRSADIVVKNESTSPTTTGALVTNGNRKEVVCTLIDVHNATTLLSNGNVTESSECTFRNNSYYTAWRLSYSYNYLADDSGASRTINATNVSISSTTDWFDIFIVISAMVVLILLTVIIVNAIKSSGMISAGSPSKMKNVGTA